MDGSAKISSSYLNVVALAVDGTLGGIAIIAGTIFVVLHFRRKVRNHSQDLEKLDTKHKVAMLDSKRVHVSHRSNSSPELASSEPSST
jgi:hypothetical protein